MKRCLLLIFLFYITINCAADTLKIYQLKHRPAAEIIELIKPFVTKETIIKANGFDLLVSGDAETHKKLLTLLPELDSAPIPLQIGLKFDSMDHYHRNQKARREVLITRNGKRQPIQDKHISSRQKVKQINTLSGQEISIEEGEIRAYYNVKSGRNISVEKKHTKANTRYLVRASLLPEDRVRIEIRSEVVKFIGQSGSDRMKTALIDSVFIGSIGQWVLIGGNAASENNANVSRYSTSASEALFVKVQVVK